MYYTNSRWKKFKSGIQHSNLKLYLVILLILAVIIIITFTNSDFIANMISSENAGNNNDNPNITPTDTSSENNSSSAVQLDKYLIRINKSENFITIYKTKSNGERSDAFKTFRCSVNPSVTTGKFHIYEKNVWRALTTGGYGQYSTRISSSCYIHSVPYYSQNSNALNAGAYNNLGNPAKVGSIYLASADAQWIYENCPMDTEVEIYEYQGETPAIELSELLPVSNNGYDPTDTSLNIKTVPTKIKYMTGVDDHSIPLGTAYNMWDGVYAVDVNNNNITEYITVTGNVNTTARGTYTLIYHLRDNFGTDLAYYSYVTVY